MSQLVKFNEMFRHVLTTPRGQNRLRKTNKKKYISRKQEGSAVCGSSGISAPPGTLRQFGMTSLDMMIVQSLRWR